MTMRKTLGGDRLGAGNKMQVEMHGYERSTHDISYVRKTTMSAGTLVPFMGELVLPGTTFDIDLNCEVLTHPSIGPLFGRYKVQLDIFLAPLRLYNSALHNNALNIGRNISQVKLPQIEMTALPIEDPDSLDDIDNCQINPSSLLAHFDLVGIGMNTDTAAHPRQFCAVKIIAYWDIYKNYYANKQEEIGMVIHTGAQALIETVDSVSVKNGVTTDLINPAPASGVVELRNSQSRIVIAFTGTQPLPEQIMIDIIGIGYISMKDLCTTIQLVGPGLLWGNYNWNKYGTQDARQWRYTTAADMRFDRPGIDAFTLTNIDDMRNAILAAAPTAQFLINDLDKAPYKYLYEIENDFPNIMAAQEGLGIKTYQSDLLNCWLSTEWIDGVGGITERTTMDTSAGLTIDTIALTRAVYNYLNRIAVSGGSYDDWQDASYAHERYLRCETPIYMGGLIKELVFQEVVSTASSDTADGTQSLATLGGKGVLTNKHKGGSVVIKADEPSYVIGIVSITPRIDYSQGNKWDMHLKTMGDLHVPALDQIGFQELVTEQMAWWDTALDQVTDLWIQKSAGKQPAWINYMTNINTNRGNFAIKNNEMFMTLNRRYEWGGVENGIKDVTTYIDPSKFNYIFANTALDAQNFWVQIACGITARRKMSGKLMPNL